MGDCPAGWQHHELVLPAEQVAAVERPALPLVAVVPPVVRVALRHYPPEELLQALAEMRQGVRLRLAG